MYQNELQKDDLKFWSLRRKASEPRHNRTTFTGLTLAECRYVEGGKIFSLSPVHLSRPTGPQKDHK
ncbi:hypothetical protein T265_00427 [Opisthorchis viverrini]|uniref:Uncharacterized protein n=1 Tax=Opisthorchis viverrini TaxID=6198 RepID=A0A075A214_OPIVI|nr:hypothetical protein T265_00427 [Opisthorchis viverrini]KER33743.1 hypothetical protein T265_00427 [Opisthorchis viverrini]